MREAMFIKKNVDKWNQYQHVPPKDADETAERFTTLVDDLSYAKTFYPRSKVTQWLNGLATTTYQKIYFLKREKLSRVFDFWKFELPYLFKQYHRIFLFTTLLFALFVIMGAGASANQPDFIKGVLGEEYVSMTEENISKGDPFGVYKDENPFSMFVRIAVNNIRVSFLTFIGGFTGGIFTFYLMWSNGLMLGSFQYIFFAHDLGIESILVIWIHGVIEISAIIIAATAGFVLAKGMLFPGTFSRIHSFKKGVKDASKIIICLIPFFIIAAFLESFITHKMSQTFDKNFVGAGLPIWGSVLILVSSIALIIWYFVIWPIRLNKKGYVHKNDDIIHRLNNENV